LTRLHITNGDSAAALIRETGIGGEVLPWRDPMHHGPFRQNVPLAKQSELRARYFAGPEGQLSDTRRDFFERDAKLKAASEFSEVVLWFEHDLLDQLQILQLLGWFNSAQLRDTHLSLICINTFPGIEPFRGIGQLNKEQMASLFSSRKSVTPAQLSLAATVWDAFCSSDPDDLLRFASRDLPDLAYLQSALRRHFEEYPSFQTGVTRTEAQILELVSTGTTRPGRIFLNNMDLETALFIGDLRTFKIVLDLCSSTQPLLAFEDGAVERLPLARAEIMEFAKRPIRITELGEAVLSGAQNAFQAIERDYWLGGVHIKSGPGMRTWDSADHSVRRMH